MLCCKRSPNRDDDTNFA